MKAAEVLENALLLQQIWQCLISSLIILINKLVSVAYYHAASSFGESSLKWIKNI